MFMMPGFSVLFGMVFRGERLPMIAFAGLALVIAASAARMPRALRKPVI
jgi:threonine/homoserine efflux transporter RhtA